MTQQTETNYNFKQVTSGAEADTLQQLAAGLLAVAARRGDGKDDPSTVINGALQNLAIQIVRERGSTLTPHQRLFLASGAIADKVTLKDESGQRVTLELLPTDVYERLLAEIEQEDVAAEYLLFPLNHLQAIAREWIKPLDLDRPGRYRDPVKQKGDKADPKKMREQLAKAGQELDSANKQLGAVLKNLIASFHSERVSPVAGSISTIYKLGQEALAKQAKPADIAALSPPVAPQSNPAIKELSRFSAETSQAFAQVEQSASAVLELLSGYISSAAAMQAAAEGSAAVPSRAVAVTPAVAKSTAADIKSTSGYVTQLLKNSQQRSTWSTTKLLMAEHTENFDDPLAECYATPQNLADSISRMDAIHPNCFVHDDAGNPLLPPIVVEPGTGVVSWLDDRFVLGFVSNASPRKGSQLSLSPLDISVMQIYGLFLARGNLFDYRGNRITGNFMADYGSDLESKAVARFTGESKKLTYTTSTTERDAASREEAVADYIDFIFHALNGLPVPKKISPRKISVILKYCRIIDEVFTADLVLRYVPAHDMLVARELMLDLAGKDVSAIVSLFRQVLEKDPQLASRYRKNLEAALADVMGREFTQDAKNDGFLADAAHGKTPAAKVGDDDAAPEKSGQHDYFDV